MPKLSQISLGLMLFLLPVVGQNATSSIRISTDPPGGRFYVDGLPYVAAQVFLWPQGSKHIVQFPTDQNLNGASSGCQLSQDFQYQYCFANWSDSSGTLTPSSAADQTVTASPSITWLQANLRVSYRVKIRFMDGPSSPVQNCSDAPGNAAQDVVHSGLVYVAGACYAASADTWAPAGPINLNAFPYPGFVFTGWNVNGQHIDAYLKSYSLTGPVTIAAEFEPAKRVQFTTSPPGLKLLIDRTPTPTASTESRDALSANFPPCKLTLNLPPMPPVSIPALCFGQFDFLPGSKHVLGAVSPQLDDAGKYWVFDEFSNGVANNSLYTADGNTSVPDSITAIFARAVQVAFLTSPPGLKLSVDGRDNWPNYNFIWAPSSSHILSAPASQVDANGRRWDFQGWSNGGAAMQTISADPSNPDVRFTATYGSLGQVKVLTNPPGIKLKIEGADCVSPCSIDRAAGVQVTIAAPSSVPVDGGSRLDFLGWSDGAPLTRSLSVTGEAQTIYANYGYSYKLNLASDPDGGVDMRCDPPSNDSFYPADTAVTVAAVARPGFRFRRWAGDLAGTYSAGLVSMSGPRNVMALLDRVPYIAPAGVRNAAAETPDPAVAPGSIISIYGESLAAQLEVGPRNPLAQTLADVVVTVNDRILPLYFVSPGQINAQILSDLPEGEYQLVVRWTGKPDVNGTLRIARNAPGLFVRDGSFGIAVHGDGTPVAGDAPATRGEVISVFGTGFGPFQAPVLDGFGAPDGTPIAVADPVKVDVGGVIGDPEWSGAVPASAGVTVVRFRVPDSVTSGNVELRVVANEKPSNTVLLPVQ